MGRASVCPDLFWFWGSHSASTCGRHMLSRGVSSEAVAIPPRPACLPSLVYSRGQRRTGCRASCGFAWMVPRTVTNHSLVILLSPACG